MSAWIVHPCVCALALNVRPGSRRLVQRRESGQDKVCANSKQEGQNMPEKEEAGVILHGNACTREITEEDVRGSSDEKGTKSAGGS